MFSSNLTVADHANAAGTFKLIEQEKTRSRRILSTSTLAAPQDMVISHSVTGSGDLLTDRHLVSFASTEILTDGSKAVTVLNFTLAVPRAGTPKTSEVVGRLINFIIGTDTARTLANLDEILLGES